MSKFSGCKIVSDESVSYSMTSFFRTMFLTDSYGNSIRMIYDSHNGGKDCSIDVWGAGSIGWHNFASAKMVGAKVLDYIIPESAHRDASTKAFEKMLTVFRKSITE